MTEEPPRRLKRMDELTVAELLDHRRNGDLPETDEYRDYRRKVLEEAGLEVESDRGERSVEEKTAADFDREIRGER